MASTTSSVWAIDIGNCSLKAMQLTAVGDGVQVTDFDVVQHSKILNGTGVSDEEKKELIAYSLNLFIERNGVGKEEVVISVPSQNSFARFVKLPPVEEKKIPEMVNYEATQQIPFDIGEVQWDWQLMEGKAEQERSVGIFAIKNEVIDSIMQHFLDENLQVSCVQMAPMAIYNYLQYDQPDLVSSDDKATVLMNIGAETTDLVVCKKSNVWQRSIPMGGNAFTRAIADTFKLNFQKAEKLKRTAPMSKYARQILQAMKPVFSDLSSEVQRSLGFYTNSNPDTEFTKILALGGGTKMRGLVKYLQQSLQMDVEIPDTFKKLEISEDVSAPKLHDHVRDMGIVYGLALQVLGFGKIESNLIPKDVEKAMLWSKKTKYFYAAAAILLVVSILATLKVVNDGRKYSAQNTVRRQIGSIISEAEAAERKLEEQQRKAEEFSSTIENAFEKFKNRDIVPKLHEKIISYLPNEDNNPEQADLYQAFRKGNVNKITQIPRKDRKQIFVTELSIEFTWDVANYEIDAKNLVDQFSRDSFRGRGSSRGYSSRSSGYSRRSSSGEETEEESGPGFIIRMAGYSPYSRLEEELLDPAGVQNNPERWGFITRLMNMKEVDPNSAFRLYGKSSVENFVLRTGPVGVSDETNTPRGVGELVIPEDEVSQYGSGRNEIEEGYLIDPLTREVISREPVMDSMNKPKRDRKGNVIYEINDKWFVTAFKIVWEDAELGGESDYSSGSSYSSGPSL